MAFMKLYPTLMQYKTGTDYAGCVVMMEDRTSGFIVYVPPANLVADLFERVGPARSDLQAYTGSVTLRAATDPTIGT